MKRFLISLLAFVIILTLTSCGCNHEFFVATCSSPKTCSICGETEGEALPHTWVDATCIAPKTCSVCTITEGNPLGHSWQPATCSTPKTCSVCSATEGTVADHAWQAATCTVPKTCSLCKKTEGKVAPHQWQEATTETPKTCSVCKKIEGSKLKTDARFTTASTKHLHGEWHSDVVFTDEMIGLDNFGSVDVGLTLTFGKTGELTQTLTLKDEAGFMAKLKTYTVNVLYAAFEEMGLSKEQSEQTMMDEYGLTINDYVEESLKGYDVNSVFGAYTFKEVYYVEGGDIYSALSWKATFQKSAYSLTDEKIRIEGLSLEDDGPELVWTKNNQHKKGSESEPFLC